MHKKEAVSMSELAESFYNIFYGIQRMKLTVAKGIKDPAERRKERNRILSTEPPQMPLDMSIGCDWPGGDEND